MQKMMMGKGARKKIRGVELLEGDNGEEEDEDEQDANWGKKTKKAADPDEANYKPRVYKWRRERKK